MASENVILDQDTLEFVKGVTKNPLVGGRAVEFKCSDTGQVTIPYGPLRGVLFLEGKAPFTPTIIKTRSGSTVLSIQRDWQFLERKYFDAAGTRFNFENARPESDHNYKIEGIWKSPAGATNFLMLDINSTTTTTPASLTNDGCAWSISGGAGTTNLGLGIARNSTTDATTHRIECTFPVRTGSAERIAICLDAYTYGTAATQNNIRTFVAKWHDTSTVIKEFGLVAADASGALAANYIDADSYFDLYRKPELTGEKMKVWVY